MFMAVSFALLKPEANRWRSALPVCICVLIVSKNVKKQLPEQNNYWNQDAYLA
jgi:hypothetical protein